MRGTPDLFRPDKEPTRPAVLVDPTAPPGDLGPLLDLLLRLGRRRLARETAQPPTEGEVTG